MSVQWVSECCGASENEHYPREVGICPKCKDHADFEESEDGRI